VPDNFRNKWLLEPWQLRALKDLMEGPQALLLQHLMELALKGPLSRLKNSESLNDMLRAQGEAKALEALLMNLRDMYEDAKKEIPNAGAGDQL
jgi:hypothetical protein